MGAAMRPGRLCWPRGQTGKTEGPVRGPPQQLGSLLSDSTASVVDSVRALSRRRAQSRVRSSLPSAASPRGRQEAHDRGADRGLRRDAAGSGGRLGALGRDRQQPADRDPVGEGDLEHRQHGPREGAEVTVDLAAAVFVQRRFPDLALLPQGVSATALTCRLNDGDQRKVQNRLYEGPGE